MSTKERRPRQGGPETARDAMTIGDDVGSIVPRPPLVSPCRAAGRWCADPQCLPPGATAAELAYEAVPDCTRCALRGCCTCVPVGGVR